MPKLCSFGCAPSGIPMHRFPNAKRFPDRFVAWVKLVGGKLEQASDYEYYQNKLICDKHFLDQYRTRNNRLSALAIPSLDLPGLCDSVDSSAELCPISLYPVEMTVAEDCKNMELAQNVVQIDLQSEQPSTKNVMTEVQCNSVDSYVELESVELESGTRMSSYPVEMSEKNTENLSLAINEKLQSVMMENKILKKEFVKLKNMMQKMKKDRRKNVLILYGIEETEKNVCELLDFVLNVFNKVCSEPWNKWEISNAHRVGQINEMKMRPIRVTVVLEWRKMELLENRRLLTENIYIKG